MNAFHLLSILLQAMFGQKKDNRKKYREHKKKKSEASLGTTYHGIVKSWKSDGYGFIIWNGEEDVEDEPQDLFFHISEVKNNISNKGSWLSNSPGRKCTFHLGLSSKSRKMEAKNVNIY